MWIKIFIIINCIGMIFCAFTGYTNAQILFGFGMILFVLIELNENN